MTYDVVIVGGGPTGLLLAAELCLGGVRPLVLERLEAPSTVPKANGLVGQVVSIMDYRGLYEPLAAHVRAGGGSRLGAMLFRLRASRRPMPTPRFTFGGFTLDLRVLGTNSPGKKQLGNEPATGNPLLILPVSQRNLEKVLDHRARKLGAVIHRGQTVTGLRTHDDGVTVDVSSTNGDGVNSRIEARYVVGCDGGHSTIRRLAGIDFPGVTTDNMVSRNAQVVLPRAVLRRGQLRLNDGRRYEPFLFHRTDRGAFSFASLQRGTHIVSSYEWDRPADGTVPMSVAELRDSVARVLGQDIPMRAPDTSGDHVLRRNDSRNTRLARLYRKGRILLAGDAAHVHFGLGGPGLNLGLCDAVNLGWKLAAEITGHAPAGLLDTYHSERYPLAERVYGQTLFQATLLSPGAGVDELRRRFAEFLSDPAHLRSVAELMAGTDLAYDNGDHLPGHPLVGRLAPDLQLTTMDRRATRIAALMRAARPVLIDLTTNGVLAKTAAGILGSPNGRVTVVAARCADRPDLSGLLLRPDGYVAWAMDRREDGDRYLNDLSAALEHVS